MTTLITGADGYLGRRIAAALDDDLILAVRAADATELAAKRARLGLPADAGADAGNAAVVPVDLRDPTALTRLDPRPVTRIVHAAAITRFNVDRDTARRVNVDGTARVREFAARCPDLQRIAVLSTLYVAGRRGGDVDEARHDDAGFVNHYEWSKWAAEELMLEASGLPVVMLRLPTIIADDGTGTVGQYNAFHNTLKLYFHGLLSLLPGDPATPLSLATAEFEVAAITALLRAPPGIYHVCPDPGETVSLGTAIDTAFDAFARDEGFRRRRLPRPIPCDLEGFHALTRAAERLRGGPINQALGSVSPFAEQLYLPKTFHNARLRAAWPGYLAPDPTALIESVCAHLVATRWGRREGGPRRTSPTPGGPLRCRRPTTS
jgi:nucleoside-diphosphate-sugar epimerase